MMNKKVKQLNKKWIIATTLAASIIVVGLTIGLSVGMTYKNNNKKYIFGDVVFGKNYHTIIELSGKNLEGYTLWINTKTDWSQLPVGDKVASLINMQNLIDEPNLSELSISNYGLSEQTTQGPCVSIANMDSSTRGRVVFVYSVLHLDTLEWDDSYAFSDHSNFWKILSNKDGYMRIKLLKQWNPITAIQWDCDLLNTTDNLYLQK